MSLVRNVPDLGMHDKRFQEACGELVYPPGSLFRIAGQNLHNWGIEITQENIRWLEERSIDSYYQEWRRGTKHSNDAIEKATEEAKLPYGNHDLNLELGLMASELIFSLAQYKENIMIADIGAGAGDTTVSVLDFLDMLDEHGDVAKKCHFYLIEPSFNRLADAKESIEKHSINKKAQIDFTPVGSNHSKHIPLLAEGKFDLVISSAVFHHMSFPTYLYQLHEKLTADGVMVIGDWYTAIWKHPGFLVDLLEKLGINDRALDRFMYQFKLSKTGIYTLDGELEAYQKQSNRMMVDYEVKIANEFQRIPESSRLYFLEAHESLEDRIRKLADAGFENDIRELKEKHRAFVNTRSSIKNLFPESDFATVISAAKIPNHRPQSDEKEIKQRIRQAIGRA